MKTNRLLYLGGLVGAALFYLFYFGWYSWFVLLLVLVLPVFSLLLSCFAIKSCRLYLRVPDNCQRGDESHLLVTVRGRKYVRGLLCVEIADMKTGKTVRRQQPLRAGGECSVRLNTSHCALLRCSAADSRICDFLGLFSFPVKGKLSAQVLVEPDPPEDPPELSGLQARRLRPKRGGGFAEEYELRPYRAGDNLRQMHWKLSAKTDSLIIREALEYAPDEISLTIELCSPGAKLDRVLGEMAWVSDRLLENGMPHEIRWIDPGDGRPAAAAIHSVQDRRLLLARLLAAPTPWHPPAAEEKTGPVRFWRRKA